MNSRSDVARSGIGSPVVVAAWIVLCGAAVALRSLDAPFVFVGSDVLLSPWDGAYHARRAFFSFVEFPALLTFDSYLRFPDGAPIPFPPLYDWLVAAVARLFAADATDATGFARVAAWVSPTLSALTLIPIFLAGRRLFDAATAWWACGLFVVLPASVIKTSLGDLDHHAAVALWVAWAFYYLVALSRVEDSDRLPTLRWSFAGGLLRAVIASTWAGSLFYLVLFEASVVVIALLRPSSRVFALHAFATVMATVVVAPLVWVLPIPIGGAYSSTELSNLHVVSLLAAGVFWSAMWVAHRTAPTHEFRPTAVRGAAIAGVVLLAMLVVPDIRNAVMPGLAFVASADTWAPGNAEQAPLFPWLGGERALANDTSHLLFGYGSWLIPLLPFVPWARGAAAVSLPTAVVFTLWSGVLGALTLAQVRFGNDFAPLASLGLAAVAGALVHRAANHASVKSSALRQAAVLLVLVLVLIPALQLHVGRAQAFVRARGLAESDFDRALVWGDAALIRFAEKIRRVTPETSGYFDPEARPEYSVLALPSYGHAIHWAAQRPTPANNFGPYLDAEKLQQVNRFYATTDVGEGLAILDQLGARYAVTSEAFWLREERVAHALHRADGARHKRSGGVPGLRLIAESEPGSVPTYIAFGTNPPRGLTPYKLWERVPGVVLLTTIGAGEWLNAEVSLATATGRTFAFRAGARADAEGVVRVQLPYATEARHEVHATGPYLVRSEGRSIQIEVSESDVLEGRTRLVEWD